MVTLIEKKIQTNPVKVIRAYCLECCLNSPKEVALCPAAGCPLHPFRMGKNPYRAKAGVTEAQRAARIANMAKLQAMRHSKEDPFLSEKT